PGAGRALVRATAMREERARTRRPLAMPGRSTPSCAKGWSDPASTLETWEASTAALEREPPRSLERRERVLELVHVDVRCGGINSPIRPCPSEVVRLTVAVLVVLV